MSTKNMTPEQELAYKVMGLPYHYWRDIPWINRDVVMELCAEYLTQERGAT